MFLILLIVLFFIVSIVFTVLYKVAKHKHWHHDFFIEMSVSCGTAIGVLFIFGSILLSEYSISKQFVETFKRQKYYIEEVVPTLPNSGNYAITQSRIELNQQLYNLQYKYEHCSFLIFYPQEIEDLEPIK